MVKIISVAPHSLAWRRRIKAGDTLVSINGNEINDVLDYRFYLADTRISLHLLRGDKEIRKKIKKGEYDDIGLEFETPLMDKKHTCRNKCIFCFIDQNPDGLRESLYFKDDDSRLSFLHGNYVTLTNMSDSDIDRIIKMRFSPINISIHTTNPDLRVRMMKNKRSGEVLSYLQRIKDAGLTMCGQIVLCRGVNDSDELRRTLRDLSSYAPEMSSVAIVPAGLTKFRDGLYPLADFSESEAREVIEIIDAAAAAHKEKYGTRLFFAADELYLKANLPIPATEYYEDFLQIENGVGMLRSFSDEFGASLTDVVAYVSSLDAPRTVSVATGAAAYPFISGYAERLMSLTDKLRINVYEIRNDFFGESITVSGLLTGKDIAAQLKGRELGDCLLIPKAALRHGEDVFLCDMTLDELREELCGIEIRPCCNDGYEFTDAVFGI